MYNGIFTYFKISFNLDHFQHLIDLYSCNGDEQRKYLP